jgi:hypothetical protein
MNENRGVRRSRAIVAGVALVLLGAVGWGWRTLSKKGHPEAPPKSRAHPAPVAPQPVPSDYAGSAACRDCHRDVWERYQSHPMARSMSRVADSEPAEDYAAGTQFARGQREYAVERIGNRVIHHERQLDREGEAIYDQAVEVHYVLGAGAQGRSFVIDRDGILFQSPIAWYARGRRWDLAPGYPAADHQRFERRVTSRCIACHTGRAAPDAEWANRFQQPAIIEFAIGCEKCHGPGGGHIAWRQGEQSAGEDPIVNPAKLEPSRRESVCNQCHLQGVDGVLRYGRSDFDFRPGMHVGEVWSILLSHRVDLHDDKSIEAVSQVEQMQSSACAQNSGGRLGCISCHDPHGVPDAAEKAAFYRAKCLACHSATDCRERPERRAASETGDSCVACHMPRLSAADIPHASQTDHRVPRRPGQARRNAEAPSGDSAGDLRIFDLAGAPLSDLELGRVRGIALVRSGAESGSRAALSAERGLEPIWAAAPDDRYVGGTLAVVRFGAHQEESAMAIWRACLELRPTNEEFLLYLAIACQKRGNREEALASLDRLLAANRWHASLWKLRLQLLVELGRDEQALESGLTSLELDPSHANGSDYQALAALARRVGRLEVADRLEQTGLRMSPAR